MARRRLRIGFVVLGTALSLVGLSGVALVGFVGFVKTEAGNVWLGATVERALDALVVTDGDLSIGALHTNLWSRWRLEDVVLTADDGTEVVRIGRVALDVAPGRLVRRRLVEPALRVDDVELDLRTLPDGTLEIVHLLGGPSESQEPGNGLPIAIDDARVDVRGLSLTMRGADGATLVSVGGLSAGARLSGFRKTIRLDDLDVGALLVTPGPGTVETRGRIWTAADSVWLDGVELVLPGSRATISGGIGEVYAARVVLDPLDLARLDPLTGGAGLAGVWAGDLALVGPAAAAHLTGTLHDVEGRSGGLIADATLDLASDEIGWKGHLDLAAFRLDGLLPATGPLLLDGRLSFDGRGIRWPDGLVVDAGFDGGPVIVGEQRFDTLKADLHVADGKVTIEEAAVDGIVGSLGLTGAVDVTGGPLDLHLSGTLDPERMARLGVEGLAPGGVVDARVTGDLQAEGAPIHVEGTVVYAPFSYGPDVRFGRLTAGFDVDVVDGVTSGSASVSTSAGTAYGVNVSSSRTPGIRFRVADGVTTVSGRTRAEAVRYPDVLTSEFAEAEWTARVAGAVSATADVTLGAYDLLGFPGDSGHAQVVVGPEIVDFDVALVSGTRDAWRVAGGYALDDGTLAFDTLALSPTARATWTAAPGARMRVADGGIRDARLDLQGNLGRIEVSGDLATKGQLDGRVVLTGFQADTLAELFPDRFSGLAGVVDLDLRVRGRAESPVLEGTVASRGLWYGEAVRWLDVSGTFAAADDRVDVALSTGVAGVPLAEIHGVVPVKLSLDAPGLDTDAPVHLDVDLRPGDLVRIGQVSPAAEGQVPAGRGSASLQVRGRLGDPDLRLAGVVEVAVAGLSRPGRVEVDVSRTGDRATMRIDALDGFAAAGSVDGGGSTRIGEVFRWALEGGPEPDFGDYGMYLDDLDLAVALPGLPVERLMAATGTEVRARGSLLGGFVVSGSPWAPTVEGGVQWLDASLGRQKLEGAYLSIVPREGGYTADLELAFPREGGLKVAGDIGVQPDFRRPVAEWVSGPLDLQVSGPGIPLGVISAFVPGVRASRTRVVIEGVVGGTPLDPDPRLSATITDGYVEIDALGLKLEDLDLHVTAEDRRVKLDELSVYPEPIQRMIGYTEIGETSRSSRITARGSMQLEGGVPEAMSAVVRLENGAWVSAVPEALLRLEGDMSVSGKWPAVEVRGDIALHTGRLVLDAASFADAAPLAPDPRLSIARGLTVALEEEVAAVAVPSLFEEVSVDVGLDLNRNLDLQWSMPIVDSFGSLGAATFRMDLDARLGGTVDLELAAGSPTLTGEVDVVEGELRIVNSNFTLEEGTIVFTGGDPFEPNLDINAQMVVPGATVDVSVAGTPSAPELTFASDEIQDDTAIMTVLITGKAPEDLTTDQGAAAAQYAAGVLLNSVLAGANLGSFSIDPTGAVKVGLPVSQRVYAESLYKPNAMSDENVIALKMDWTIFPRLVLSAGLGDYEQWTDLYWELRF